MFRKIKEVIGTILGTLFIFFIVFLFLILGFGNNSHYQYNNVNNTGEKIKIIKQILNQNYYDYGNKLGLLKNINKVNDYNSGFLDLLDDQFTFVTKKENIENQLIMTNEKDFGIYFLYKDKKFKVFEAIPNTLNFGKLLYNDEILKINDIDISNLSKKKIYDILDKKDIANLTIKRNKKILNVTIEKDYLPNKSVKVEKISNNILKINIYKFTNNTFEDFKNEIEKVKLNNIKGIILDLRTNGGGETEEAVKIASLWADKNDKIITLYFKNYKNTIYAYDNNLLSAFKNKKTIILTNSRTASSSEIVTSFIKEKNYYNTIIIGTKTYGKCSALNIADINDIVLVYTVGYWETSQGYVLCDINNFNIHKGIIPDIELKLENNGTDNQLEKAISLIK